MARRVWDEAEAEADRLDPRWRLDDFLADLEKIPDEENAAITISALARQRPWYMVAGAPGYDTLFGGLQPNTRLNERQLKVIRDGLSNVAERLKRGTQAQGSCAERPIRLRHSAKIPWIRPSRSLNKQDW